MLSLWFIPSERVFAASASCVMSGYLGGNAYDTLILSNDWGGGEIIPFIPSIKTSSTTNEGSCSYQLGSNESFFDSDFSETFSVGGLVLYQGDVAHPVLKDYLMWNRVNGTTYLLVRKGSTPFPSGVSGSFNLPVIDVKYSYNLLYKNPYGGGIVVCHPSYPGECVGFVFWNGTGHITYKTIYISPPVNPTCTTPTIPNQVIPSILVSDFGGVGSIAGGKDFTMEFINCENLSKIRYKIEPASGVSPNPSQGFLPLSPYGSSDSVVPTGVAMQIMDSATGGTPAVTMLGAWREINTSSSSYSVPLRARYVRTGTQGVTPGIAKAEVKITIEYQ